MNRFNYVCVVNKIKNWFENESLFWALGTEGFICFPEAWEYLAFRHANDIAGASGKVAPSENPAGGSGSL